MRTRIMSGAVLIVILFTCLYFGGWVTFGFSLFISLVGMYELIKVKKLEKTGLAVVGYIAAITYYFILLLLPDFVSQSISCFFLKGKWEYCTKSR